MVLDHDPAADDNGCDIDTHCAFDKGFGDVELRVYPRIAGHPVEIDEDRVALHTGEESADLAGKTGRLGAVHGRDLERLVGAQRMCGEIESMQAMHFVHHPQLHHGVLVVVDGLVV